jgi:hypothetical protein
MLTRLVTDDWGDTYEDDYWQEHDSCQEHDSWQEPNSWQEHDQQEHDQQEHETTDHSYELHYQTPTEGNLGY